MIIISMTVTDDQSHISETEVLTVDERMFHNAFQEIDLPKPYSDVFTQMLCTPPARARVVMKLRKDMAKMLSERFTEIIMKKLEAKDTVCGYPYAPSTIQ